MMMNFENIVVVIRREDILLPLFIMVYIQAEDPIRIFHNNNIIIKIHASQRDERTVDSDCTIYVFNPGRALCQDYHRRTE